MRRKNREITGTDELVAVMKKCTICRLALNDGEYPYILPLNFGIETDGGKVMLYFHSALAGYKVELFKKNPRASFEMDCGHGLEYVREKGYCTMHYESVIGHGRIKILEDEEDRRRAIASMMEHYHGKDAPYNPQSLPQTLIYALCVEEMTGKRNLPAQKAQK